MIGVGIGAEVLQVAAGFNLNLVVDLVVGRQNRLLQVLLVQVEGPPSRLRIGLGNLGGAGCGGGLFEQTGVGAAKRGLVGTGRGEAQIEAIHVAARSHLVGLLDGVDDIAGDLGCSSAIRWHAFGRATGVFRWVQRLGVR